MLTSLIGDLGIPAAAFLIALCAGLTVVSTSMIVKRRSAKVLDQEHELKMYEARELANRAQFDLETSRGFKYKQLDQGLITSHRNDDRGNQ